MKNAVPRLSQRLFLLPFLFSFIFLTQTCQADDVTDSINEALQYYNDGQYGEAVTSLNYASQIIQQKKGQALESYLPAPLSGWTSTKTNSQSAGVAMFGGGITAERKYTKGTSSITVQLITDSPMLQGIMMMLSNPMFASSGGGKLERIGKQKGIVNYDAAKKSGDIKIVAANRFLISIEGSKVDMEELMAYANEVDYEKLTASP